MLNILKFFADFDFHCGRGGATPLLIEGIFPNSKFFTPSLKDKNDLLIGWDKSL